MRKRKGKRKHSCRRLAPDGPTTTKIDTREYQHLTRFYHATAWNESVKLREPEYASLIRAVPSFKVSSSVTYQERLSFIFENLHFLLRFSKEHGFRKWHVSRQRFSKKRWCSLRDGSSLLRAKASVLDSATGISRWECEDNQECQSRAFADLYESTLLCCSYLSTAQARFARHASRRCFQ